MSVLEDVVTKAVFSAAATSLMLANGVKLRAHTCIELTNVEIDLEQGTMLVKYEIVDEYNPSEVFDDEEDDDL